MRIFIEDYNNNKQIELDKAIEEAILFIDCKEYEKDDSYLDLFVLSSNGDMNAYEYLMNSFAIYQSIYKQIPEFLIFLRPNIFKEVLVAYELFAKASDVELVTFSIEKALERGVSKEWLNDRYVEYSTMLNHSADEYIL